MQAKNGGKNIRDIFIQVVKKMLFFLTFVVFVTFVKFGKYTTLDFSFLIATFVHNLVIIILYFFHNEPCQVL